MADITEVDYIWKNGEMIPWAEATTHVLSHSLHYGSGVFEGIRCYQNPETKKSYVFRLRDHMERLHRSCKISLIDLPYSVDELCDATIELIRKIPPAPPPTWLSPCGRGTPTWETVRSTTAWPWACRRGASVRTTPFRLRLKPPLPT